MRILAAAVVALMLALVQPACAQNSAAKSPAAPPPAPGAGSLDFIEALWLGARVVTVTPEKMSEHGLVIPFGALVEEVYPGAPAEAAGLRRLDVIVSAGTARINSVEDLEAVLAKLEPGQTLQLGRLSGGAASNVTLMRPSPPPVVVAAGATPQMMLDTGGHMAAISDLVFTPDSRQLVTAGADKVIRVWDLASGKTVRTLRGEIGEGHIGKVYAVALSPDGRLLAAGGDFRNSDSDPVRLYEFSTGRLLRVLIGYSGNVFSLAFSPNGERLIAGGSDTAAIVWDIRSGQQLTLLKGHRDSINAVCFTKDGTHAITGSDDRTLRLWRLPMGATGRKNAEVASVMRHNDKVIALAVSPKDGHIASESDNGEIKLWHGQTGQPVRFDAPASGPAKRAPGKGRDIGAGGKASPAAGSKEDRKSSAADKSKGAKGAGKPGVLVSEGGGGGALAFSPDGSKLLATIEDDDGHQVAAVLDVATGRKLMQHKGHQVAIVKGAISPNGVWAATAGNYDHEIHVWRLSDGVAVQTLVGQGRAVFAAGFSKDGKHIAWGNSEAGPGENDFARYEYKLRLPTRFESLGRPEEISAFDGDWLRFRTTHGQLSIAIRDEGTDKYNSAILDLMRDQQRIASVELDALTGIAHNAFTFSADGKAIFSGTLGGEINRFDVGKLLAARRGRVFKLDDLQDSTLFMPGHVDDIFALTASGDGRLLISGSDDQTVRLWNARSGEPIATLYHGMDGEWVMWTPQGFYTGSPGSGTLVGWQLNNGEGHAADYVRGQQFRDKLNRPDIIEEAIRVASAERAANQLAPGHDLRQLLRARPPVIQRVDVPKESFGGRTQLEVRLAPNALPIDHVDVHVTGPGKSGESKVTLKRLPVPPGKERLPDGSTTHLYEIPLFQGVNTIRVVAANAAAESDARIAATTHTGEGALDRRGTLWLLAVGVDKYPGAAGFVSNLDYAGRDATALAETIAQHMKAGHDRIDATVLVNGGSAAAAPTRANILAAIARITTAASDNDTVMFYLAGHGENWKGGGRYHFLPTDFGRKSETEIGDNVIDWADDIQKSIVLAKGRKVLFLDACHSGNAYNKTLLTSADADRFVAFSAAGPEQEAWEFHAEQHGAFTWILMQGLKGDERAVDPVDRAVTVYRLGDFLNVEVRRRTQGKQAPEYRSGQGNFALVRR